MTNNDYRPQPHNLNAEAAILGAILKEPSEVIDTVSRQISPDAFYSEANRHIYAAIMAVHHAPGNSIDAITVAHELEGKQQLEAVGGEIRLFELVENLPTTANIQNWLEIARDMAARRAVIQNCTKISGQAYELDSPAAATVDSMEIAAQAIRQASTVSSAPDMLDLLQAAAHGFTEPAQGITYGFPEIDAKVIHEPGDFHAIAAESGVGKTTFAISCMIRQAAAGIRTALYCTETGSRKLMQKTLAAHAQIAYSRLARLAEGGELCYSEAARYEEAFAMIAELVNSGMLFIRGTGDFTATPGGIASDCKLIRQRFGSLGCAWVDYLQDLDTPRGIRPDDENAKNTLNVQGLKHLFQSERIAGIVLCQINREGQKSGSRPRKWHIKNCGKLENAAHIISFLHDKNEPGNTSGIIDLEMYSDKSRDFEPYLLKLQRHPAGPCILPAPSQGRYAAANQPIEI